MSRWHDPHCRTPDVILDSQSDSPVCRACGMSFAKSRASAEGQSALQIPQDEAPGSKLNLHWPATVNYKSPQGPNQSQHLQDSQDSQGSSTSNGRGEQKSKATTSMPPQRKSSPPPPQPRPCYAPRLSQSQIRLLRISAADPNAESSSNPKISHVDLEVYQHDQCPEYETMSYTWGGENGDSAPSQPVFIGNYWDVVWQTRNCCAMLQYLRPVEGFRLVWVDALCINQQDSREREQQVAMMARIYKEARRVVVYLGSDLVTPTPGTHPRRQKLQDSIYRGAYSYPRPRAPAAERYIPIEDYTYDDGRDPNNHSLDAILSAQKVHRLLGKHRSFGNNPSPVVGTESTGGGVSSGSSAAGSAGRPSVSNERRDSPNNNRTSQTSDGSSSRDSSNLNERPSKDKGKGKEKAVDVVARPLFSPDHNTSSQLHASTNPQSPSSPTGRPNKDKGKGKEKAVDVAVRPSPTRPRSRYYDGHGNIDFVALMQRRYFSRIWVVQELALSRQVSIAVGDFEVWADALTPEELKRNHPGWHWEETKAPWVQNMAQREIPDMDLYQIMRATAKSESSDPRDRVFGVFALLGAGGRGLEPNYSLSPLHCFIGTCAHLILNLGHAELFRSAAGLAAQSPWPSWMPDYRSAGWVRLLHGNDDDTEVDVERDPFYKWWNKEEAKDLMEEIERAGNQLPKYRYGLFKVSAEALRKRTDKELHEHPQVQSTIWDNSFFAENRLPSALYSVETAYKASRWNSQTSVEAENGSMILDLIHLLQFQKVPIRMSGLPKHIRNPVFGLEGVRDTVDGTGTAMYLVTDGFDLSTVQPGTDHLYILDRQNGTCLFFVLRETAPRTFRLVTCVRQIWFCAARDSWTRMSVNRTYDKYDEGHRDADSTRETLRYDTKLFLSDLQRSLFAHDPREKLLLNLWDEPDEATTRLYTLLLDPPRQRESFSIPDFSLKVTSPDITQFCQGLINEQRGDSPGVLSSYASLFNPVLKATVRDDCVEITIPPNRWDDMHGRFSPAYTDLFKEWRFAQSSDTKSWSTSRTKLSLLRRNKAVCVRARRADIMALGVQIHGYKVLLNFTRARKLTGKTEAELYAHKGPYTDDGHSGCRNIASPVWPERIVDGFGIDGSTYKVTIA